MKVICVKCGKDVNKKPSEIKRAKNSFCSKECKDKWESENLIGKKSPHYNRIKCTCKYCNEDIWIEKAKYKKYQEGKIKNLFCNRNCKANFEKENKKDKQLDKYIEKLCEYCNEKYSVLKTRSDSKYCSKECKDNYRKTEIEVICDFCGDKFNKIPSQIKSHNFCSKQCSCDWSSEFNNKQKSKTCINCGNIFKVPNTRSDNARTCSKECHNKWLKEVYCKQPEVIELYRQKGIKSNKLQNKKDTKPERIVREFLEKYHINFIPQHPMYNRFVVDFYLPEKDIIIEVLGDYWHSNPLFYGNEEGKKPLSDRQIKIKQKDQTKFSFLGEQNHNIIGIWENDIYKDIDNSMSFLF